VHTHASLQQVLCPEDGTLHVLLEACLLLTNCCTLLVLFSCLMALSRTLAVSITEELVKLLEGFPFCVLLHYHTDVPFFFFFW
jgi:hypothetical protein